MVVAEADLVLQEEKDLDPDLILERIVHAQGKGKGFAKKSVKGNGRGKEGEKDFHQVKKAVSVVSKIFLIHECALYCW